MKRHYTRYDGRCSDSVGLRQHPRAQTEASLQKADTLKAATTLSSAAVDANAWPDSDWWTQFRDPQLTQ